MTGAPPAELVAALENLAAALDPREFTAVLITGPERRPCLTVAHPLTYTTENIYADRSASWWPWVQPIAATSDPLTAAHRITAMLGAAPGAALDPAINS